MSPPALIAAGTRAPSFRWRTEGGTESLENALARAPVLLLFYPLAYAPIGLADLPPVDRMLQRLPAASLIALGISVDATEQAEQFFSDLRISRIQAVGDPDLNIASAYGVRRAEGFSELASILLDRQGLVCRAQVHPLCFPRPCDLLARWLEELSIAVPSADSHRS